VTEVEITVITTLLIRLEMIILTELSIIYCLSIAEFRFGFSWMKWWRCFHVCGKQND